MRPAAYAAQAVRAPVPRDVPAELLQVADTEDLLRRGFVRVGVVFDRSDGRFVSVWIGHEGIVLFCERLQRAVRVARATLLQIAIEAGIFQEASDAQTRPS